MGDREPSDILERFQYTLDNRCDKSLLAQLAQDAIEHIKYLRGVIAEKDKELTELRLDLVCPTRNKSTSNNPPMEFPAPRGTTHGQLLQMQHEAETMHSNPPLDQPMG